MTPPATRRSTYARRTQYSVFAAYVVAITGGLVALLCAILAAVDPAGFAALRTAAHQVTAPFARASGSAFSAVSGIDDEVAAFWRAGSQNAGLQRELAAARRQLVSADALRTENENLRALLRLTRSSDTVVASARLLSSTATSIRRFALIDAGANRGVQPGQPVRSADGLIGRTLHVGPTVARILLITDPQSVIPVRRASDGMAALVSGTGDRLLEVRSLNSATNVLRVGDVLLTSGSGGLYQPRTPVALIVRINGEVALARPIASAAVTDAVIVEQAVTANLAELPPEPASLAADAEEP